MKLITYSASPIPFHLFLLLCPQLAGAHICLGSARSRISLGVSFEENGRPGRLKQMACRQSLESLSRETGLLEALHKPTSLRYHFMAKRCLKVGRKSRFLPNLRQETCLHGAVKV